MARFSFLLVLAWLCLANAKWLATNEDQYCVYGCDAILSYVTFKDKTTIKSSNTFVTKCSSQIRAQSLFYCAATYCSPHDIQAGLAAQNQSCWEEAGINYPSYQAAINALPRGGLKNITTFSKKSKKTDPAFNSTAIPAKELFEQSLGTISVYYNNHHLTRDLSFGFYGFWALVVLLGLGNRVSGLLSARSKRSTASAVENDVENGPQKRGNRLVAGFQRHILHPALFNGRCQESVGPVGVLPNRLESAVIALYFILNFIYMLPGYHIYQSNIWWAMNSVQLAHEISDRAANLAIPQLPLLWIFSARNDPLLWLTGWTFATFNAFHRWIARFTMLLLIVHPGAYTYAAAYDAVGEYASVLAKPYFRWGIASVCLFSVLIGSSIFAFRRKFYDIWLLVHIMFAAVFLGALYYHVNVWNGYYNGYIWACVAIWAFDRVLRIGRIAHRAIVSKGAQATATYNSETDIVRLDVSDSFSKIGKPLTGVHYFIYEPSNLRGWESHPFTLCTWRKGGTLSPPSPRSETHDAKELHESTRSASDDGYNGNNDLNHTFLIRPRSGFTRRLKNKVIRQGNGSGPVELRILLEGPYGAAQNLSKHSNVLMIAGGSGITPTISHATSLRNTGTKVHIVWAVREYGYYQEVYRNELSGVQRLDVYLTKGNDQETKDGTVAHHGRPDIAALLRETRATCDRDLAVLCCGPAKMADETRREVVNMLKEKGPAVSFHDERFGW